VRGLLKSRGSALPDHSVKLGKFNRREIGDSKLHMEAGFICDKIATKPVVLRSEITDTPVLRNNLHTLLYPREYSGACISFQSNVIHLPGIVRCHSTGIVSLNPIPFSRYSAYFLLLMTQFMGGREADQGPHPTAKVSLRKTAYFL
jgi:hypothetical protein